MKLRLMVMTLALSLMGSALMAQEAPAPEQVSETDIYPYRLTSYDKNDMQIINNGIAALYARIDMIRRATTSLDLEYFIFNPDSTGRIVFKELVKAAERGVKVRVLIDKSVAVFKLDEYYAQLFREHNIELRYYNAASVLKISSTQFRNHRKLFLRDGVEAITGGRNIADEYFNLSTSFNFLDRDVWVQGDIVKAMKDTFDLYWDSDIVQTPGDPKNPKQKKLDEAQRFVAENEADNKTLEYIMSFGKKTLATTNKYNCPEAAFATDREGASFVERIHSKDYHQNYRLLRKEIAKWMGKVQDEIILDSPYFLNDKRSREIVNQLLDSDKKITILTNSLNSTDAIYVSTVFSNTVRQYTPNKNFSAYVYKGTFSNESELMNDEIKNSEWGTHSKTIVYSDNSFMVGTFNIDNRSNFYNTEMAIFCGGSPELTKDILSNIKVRMGNSHHLNKDGVPDDGAPLLEGASFKKKLLYYMLKLPATIGQFLM